MTPNLAPLGTKAPLLATLRTVYVSPPPLIPHPRFLLRIGPNARPVAAGPAPSAARAARAPTLEAAGNVRRRSGGQTPAVDCAPQLAL